MPSSGSAALHHLQRNGARLAGWNSSDEMETEVTPASNATGFRFRPLQVTWEMTRACDWKSNPGRGGARSRREPDRFSTAEAFHLIENVAELQVPLLALTGGDPMLRADLFPVIEFASRRSVRMSLTLLTTPSLSSEAIAELKASGLMRLAFWVHGSTAGLDDAHWKLQGTHRRTLDLIGACHEAQLPVQINTTLARRNWHDLDAMIELFTRLDVTLWNVFFFVPTSREQASEMLTAEELEQVFAKLCAASKVVHFQIKTTEGQHYQRYLLQQRARETRGRLSDMINESTKRVDEGKGFVFISHEGEVFPSRFLPVSGGNVMNQSLSEIYNDSPLFVSLRESSRLKGKCGRCIAAKVCGGSRARAYAMTGDLFAADPCCAFEP